MSSLHKELRAWFVQSYSNKSVLLKTERYWTELSKQNSNRIWTFKNEYVEKFTYEGYSLN